MVFRHLVLLLAGSLALAGCGPQFPDPAVSKLAPNSREAVLGYTFPEGGTRLERGMRQKVDRFLRDPGLSSRDVVVISVPPMKTSAGTEARRHEMISLLARYPARLRLVDTPPPTASGRSDNKGIIRIARVTSLDLTCDPGSAGIGCANAHNLAHMVAVPADILLPVRGKTYIATPANSAQSLIPGGIAP